MALCKDCVVLPRHEGTPTGKLETIGGVEAYIALPGPDGAKDTDKTKAILFLTDVFGHKALHAQLLADDFARFSGLPVFAPDYLNGDPVTMEMVTKPGFDVYKDIGEGWMPRHTPVETQPVLDALIAGLHERGITTFGSTGYCFGGRYGVDLALAGVVKSSVIAHPGSVTEDDFHKLVEASKVPFMIVSCEDDFTFGLELQAKADEVLGGGKYKARYERKFFAGAKHGFAVRADPKDPVAMAAKEGAFKDTIEWFRDTLQTL